MNRTVLTALAIVPIIMLAGCTHHHGIPSKSGRQGALQIHGTDAEHHSAQILILNARPHPKEFCRQHGNHWHCAR
ncbi:hypothetical protein Sama_3638 [Shewanella amazonensis SB2B]|uniref:Lipoprotein n=1 Tax=Shewanella amazonensis (strain ATCC BAA-1098 / SB2B) TaxID=326297 RepID=A1SBT4_SHEAM|nr:hypothetical protein Sama_3638 [Shewanella amazonensis SB2B]